MQLYEQYRPSTWPEVLGQDKILRKIGHLRKRGLAGRAYWLSGQTGTGKTTIARLIAAELADPTWGAIVELDAKEINAQRLRDIEDTLHTRGMGSRSGRAVIINEAHGLSRAAITQLLTTLERIPPHVVWIFTTTIEGQECLKEAQIDAHPLLSRCIELPLARRGLAEAFATHAQTIARTENLDGRPIKDYMALAKRCKNNLRQMLQAIEAGDMADD